MHYGMALQREPLGATRRAQTTVTDISNGINWHKYLPERHNYLLLTRRFKRFFLQVSCM